MKVPQSHPNTRIHATDLIKRIFSELYAEFKLKQCFCSIYLRFIKPIVLVLHQDASKKNLRERAETIEQIAKSTAHCTACDCYGRLLWKLCHNETDSVKHSAEPITKLEIRGCNVIKFERMIPNDAHTLNTQFVHCCKCRCKCIVHCIVLNKTNPRNQGKGFSFGVRWLDYLQTTHCRPVGANPISDVWAGNKIASNSIFG